MAVLNLGVVVGKSAYQLAFDADNTIGTEAQWLATLKGADGSSAYQAAKAADNTIGTEAEWLATLKGADGTNGNDFNGTFAINANGELILTTI